MQAYNHEYLERHRGDPEVKYHWMVGSAKQKGIDFNWEQADFIAWFSEQEKKCHYCLHSIKQESRGKTTSFGLTLDRRDPKGIYEKANVVLCCRRCNSIKSNWLTEKQMLEFARRFLQ